MEEKLYELGQKVDRKRVWSLMRLMGIDAIYPKPNLSKANAAHKIYLYLLRALEVERANHVWEADISYIPKDKGFAYLVAGMDLYSRKVLSCRPSNSLDTSFCVDVLKEAIYKYGTPEIFNYDQSLQFKSEAFKEVLKS